MPRFTLYIYYCSSVGDTNLYFLPKVSTLNRRGNVGEPVNIYFDFQKVRYSPSLQTFEKTQ